jgi:hypothetical protein
MVDGKRPLSSKRCTKKSASCCTETLIGSISQKRLVPQWDLGLVLSALKLPPFEPATEVDIKFVSYKCCFLLALASGRRRSEIHALELDLSEPLLGIGFLPRKEGSVKRVTAD